MNTHHVHNNEKIFFTISLVLSSVIYFFLIISRIGIFYIVIGVGVTLFIQGLNLGYIRSNSVKISKRQFPEVYERAEQIAHNMGLSKLPELYIVQEGGLLNAFATNFLGRNYVVLYSEVMEFTKEGYESELDFIIAHEFAHIKRRHVSKHLFILPALWVPFLGKAYSRACEYTCDRMATAFIEEPDKSVNAIAILAIGKKLVQDMDIHEYLNETSKETGFFVWLSHVMSTHPPLPRRIMEVQQYIQTQSYYQAV